MPVSRLVAALGSGFVFPLSVGIASLIGSCGTSKAADTIQTFDLSGVFQSGTELGGTITVDTTAGLVTAADITLSGSEDFTLNDVGSQSDTGGYYPAYTVEFYSLAGFSPIFELAIDGSSLVGYDGGILDGVNDHGPSEYSSDLQTNVSGRAPEMDLLESGTVAVPEPAFMGLLTFAGAATMRGRRRLIQLPTPKDW